MKHIKHLILAFLLLTINFTLSAEDNHNQSKKTIIGNGISENDIQLSKAQTVYICTGSYCPIPLFSTDLK